MSSPIPSPACRIAVISYSSRQSSRPRPVIISYRIPDDTATQSITCDTGYDDIRLSLRSISSLYFASRPASRLTVSPDGSAQGTTPSCSLFASFACPPRSISSAHPSSPLLAPAPTHAANPSHPSHPLRYISSAHLPSRPASSFASRRASSLVSSRLTACPASRFALLHLIGLSFISLLIRLVHLIHLIHIIYLIGIVPLH